MILAGAEIPQEADRREPVLPSSARHILTMEKMFPQSQLAKQNRGWQSLGSSITQAGLGAERQERLPKDSVY